MADIECPICGKSLSYKGLLGHLSWVHDFRKPEDMDQYDLVKAIENGELEIEMDESEQDQSEEGSEGMKEDTEYLNEIFDGLEPRSGYYKQPKGGDSSKSEKSEGEEANTGGVGNFFSFAPNLDYFKWGKRLAIAGLVTGGFVCLYKNWEGISDSLQKANETEDQSVNAEDVKDSGKDNGKKESESSPKGYTRISDL